ncbi:response regulator [Myxococcota bacterium]|nr:response regulator [Myxococcota bacterium]
MITRWISALAASPAQERGLILVAALCGAALLCLLSLLQKLYIGAPINTPTGYITPILFGGGAGALCGALLITLRRAFHARIEALQEVNARLREENAARAAAERALEIERARYEALFSMAPVALMVLGPDGALAAHNQAAEALYGERLEGDEALVRATPQGAEAELELLGAHDESRIIWRTRVPLPDQSELICDRDLTLRKRLEAQLVHAQKMEAVREMAGGIAHDFNNLMAGIVGNAELGMLDPDEEGYERIRDLAQHAAKMARRLLDLGQPEHHQPSQVDLNEVVREAVQILRPSLNPNIELICALSPAPALVKIDPVQLEQVIINLLINARDALPCGGQIAVEVSQAEGVASLVVSDTGEGMSEAVQRRAFEPFFTTKATGNGLGLSMVRQALQAAGGEIALEHAEGLGARLRAWLPCEPTPLREAASTAPPPSVTQGVGYQLWLVDDNPIVLASLTRLLARLGFGLRAFNDPLEALQAAQEALVPPDLVISDVVMPHLNGPAMVARLRARWPQLKALFLSAYHAEFEAIDRQNYLSKPFKAADLYAKIFATLNP